ncbi:MAG: hypothetical protein HUJ76_13235, partial [Parasporobacterium sp.]|nr:hypothetical protein [Parasporobacterium sp.]
ATGDQLTYQWQKKVSGGSWINTGSNSASFTITNTTPSDNGTKVKCIVTDKYGDQIISNQITLTVSYTPLAITSNLTNKNAAPGDAAVFAITAQGDQLTYQWQKKVSGGTWTNIGTNASSYTIQSVQISDNGTQIRCIVTDKYGDQITSNEAALTVGYTPLEITQDLYDVTVNRGEDVVFNVSAVGDGITYMWKIFREGSGWDDVGENSPTFTLENVSPEDNGIRVKCALVDRYMETASTIFARVTVVYTPLEITSNPSNKTAARGTSAQFTIAAAGDQLSYQWQKNVSGGSWSNVGANSASYTTAATVPADNGTKFRCIVTDKYGDQVTSNEATLTVSYTPLRITTNPSNKTVYAGSSARFTIAATGDQLTYQWQ